MYVAVSLLNHGCIFVGSTVLFIKILNIVIHVLSGRVLMRMRTTFCIIIGCALTHPVTIKFYDGAVHIKLHSSLQGASYVRSHGRSSCGKNVISRKCSPPALYAALFSTNRVSNQLINLMIDHVHATPLSERKLLSMSP